MWHGEPNRLTISNFYISSVDVRWQERRLQSPHLRCDVIADAAAAGIRWIHPPPRIEADDLTNISFDLKTIQKSFLLEANVFDIKD